MIFVKEYKMSSIERIHLFNKRGQELSTITFPIEEISQVEIVEIITRRKERIIVHIFQNPDEGCQITVHRAYARTLQLYAPRKDET